ncbi:hypothetical protein CO655_20990 [Rhizobium sp. M1]|nr:hypothetical protein CO655_20990 [Rhizobium sp. M1]PDT35433.1 hypothetical protein CO671_17130 [Rhizobium sp. M10]
MGFATNSRSEHAPRIRFARLKRRKALFSFAGHGKSRQGPDDPRASDFTQKIPLDNFDDEYH